MVFKMVFSRHSLWRHALVVGLPQAFSSDRAHTPQGDAYNQKLWARRHYETRTFQKCWARYRLYGPGGNLRPAFSGICNCRIVTFSKVWTPAPKGWFRILFATKYVRSVFKKKRTPPPHLRRIHSFASGDIESPKRKIRPILITYVILR